MNVTPIGLSAERDRAVDLVDAHSPRPADVEVTRTTSHGWRVSDGRLPAGHPMRVLGHVERRGDAYETLQLGAGFESHDSDSLEDAIAFVLSTAAAMARLRHDGSTWGIR